MVRLGQGSYVGLGLTTPYTTNGTSADIGMHYQVVSGFDSLQLERDILEFDDLTANWKDTNLLVGGQRRVTGSITLKLFYSGLQDLMRMLTGHNPTPSGSGPYTYAFSPRDKSSASHYWLGTTGRGWVIELYRGGGVANSVYYQGCEISELRLNFTPNAFVEAQISFIGRGYTIGAKTATPTYLTDPMFTPTGQDPATLPFLDLGGTAYPVRGSASVVITSGVDFNYDMTAIETAMPLPTGKDMATFEAETEVDDDLLLNVLNDPEGSRFSSGFFQLENQGNGSAFALSFNEGVLRAPAESRPQGHGVQLARLSIEAWSPNATTAAITASVLNQDSAYNT